MVGLLALFAEAVVSDAGSVANAEFALAKLLSSFRRNDANGDGYMYAADLRGALEQIGIICTEEEFKDIFVQFDDNNDGRISSEEFIKALRPHLALQSRTCEGTSVADAIRTMALTARQHGDSSVVERLKRWAMGMSRLLSEHKPVVLWLVWLGVGALWGCIHEGLDPLTSLRFALASLSTLGNQPPPLNADGVLPASTALFCTLYCLSGIPIWVMALGRLADKAVTHWIAEKERSALRRPISDADYTFAQGLFGYTDGEVDLAEFIALELLRLGKINASTLEILLGEFKRLDQDGSGRLSREEALDVRNRV